MTSNSSNPGCAPHLKYDFAVPSKKKWNMFLQQFGSQLDF